VTSRAAADTVRLVFDHVTIRVSDRAASEEAYAVLMETLGLEITYSTHAFAEWRDFSLTQADDAHPVTRNLHLGFVSPSREQCDAFWEAGRAAGLADDGAPGPRPQYLEDYYGAFLRDPDGNSVEAVHYDRVRRDGIVDHLWLRTRDVAAAARFYKTIQAAAGYEYDDRTEGQLTVRTPQRGGSMTFVPGETPTENVHFAFPGTEDQVRRFHADAIAAGYRDNGAPGERPQYHPGYYGAYVLDPDGHNVEVVDHHREG
jgi:catechol 2,3-dioxygenase-like lactoylglutathione lyase family enzyme